MKVKLFFRQLIVNGTTDEGIIEVTPLTDSQWGSYGWDSHEPCCLCGASGAKLTPRFDYPICRTHAPLSPVQVSVIREVMRVVKLNGGVQRD